MEALQGEGILEKVTEGNFGRMKEQASWLEIGNRIWEPGLTEHVFLLMQVGLHANVMVKDGMIISYFISDSPAKFRRGIR